MKILKIMNNNAVSSTDEKDREIIVLGKGIGFQKQVGAEIDNEKIEKIFRLPATAENQFEKLVEEIPYEYVKYTDEIIRYASKKLDKKLNRNIYITLTDHLNFAIERKKQGIFFQNALLWEIQHYYKPEYEIGLDAIRLISLEEGIELPVDEAASIALHIVNAEMDDMNLHRTMNIPGIIKDILNIVKYTYHIEFDDKTLSYERFIRHLRSLIQRAISNQYYPADEDQEFYISFQKKYPKEYACAYKIKNYIEKKTKYTVTDEEVMYLTLHISRVTRTTP